MNNEEQYEIIKIDKNGKEIINAVRDEEGIIKDIKYALQGLLLGEEIRIRIK